ncbi:MAG TPA: hypothetical protein VK724_21030 [Bryobacteraceae bacterium]|jgi:uncharacterized protein (TIGR03437 family)|nr:hypothetical protein [Bryobacteraceae bacterium]
MKTYGGILSFSLLLAASAGVCSAQATITNVLNGASFATGQPITGGSLITIFGTNLATTTAGADTIPLSTHLGGVSLVQFQNGSTKINAPILFVGPTQLNVQVPWDIVPAGTTATVKVVVNSNGNLPSANVTVGPFSPGIFAFNNTLAIASNFSDGSYPWPVGAVAGLTSHPAKMGDVLVIYATGLGAVNGTTPANGDNTGGATISNQVTPQVLIGGVSAQVAFAGLSPQFVGVNQLNVVVPNVAPGSAVPLQIMVGGITSPATTTIAITQ